MELTGRTAGYRGVAIRCPGCGDAMRAELLDDAEVDVCGACGGIWVDWFDGELRSVANEVVASESQRGLSGAPAPSNPNESQATGACPRCAVQLVVDRYMLRERVAAATAAEGRPSAPPLSGPTGAELLRCEHCAGSFVSKTSAEMLAVVPPEEEPPPSMAVRALEPLPWQRFLAVVRRLVGIG